jgi:hypothetical protein
MLWYHSFFIEKLRVRRCSSSSATPVFQMDFQLVIEKFIYYKDIINTEVKAMKIVRAGRGWTVRGRIGEEDWEKLEKWFETGHYLVFGYYGDIWVEKRGDEFVTTNTATGTVLYRGKDLKEAIFRGWRAGKRYDDLDDKYFHNDTEKAMLRW